MTCLPQSGSWNIWRPVRRTGQHCPHRPMTSWSPKLTPPPSRRRVKKSGPEKLFRLPKSCGNSACDDFYMAESARAELRAIERETAIRILRALDRYGDSGDGDVKAFAGESQGYFRIRVGDYRVILMVAPEKITIVRVRHRSDVYR